MSREWKSLAVVDIDEPGRYEILHQNGIGVGIRKIGENGPGPIDHGCTPCSCCDACGCEYNGKCRGCDDYARWSPGAEAQLQAYLAAVESPEGWFIQNTNGSRLVHAPGCSSHKSSVLMVTAALDAGCTHEDMQGNFPHCPIVIREEELRTGKRCRVCAPEVTPPERTGKFVAGGSRG